MVLLVEFSGRIVFFELESLGVFASLRDIIFRGREHGVSQSYPSMIMVPPSSPCFPIYTHISQLGAERGSATACSDTFTIRAAGCGARGVVIGGRVVLMAKLMGDGLRVYGLGFRV